MCIRDSAAPRAEPPAAHAEPLSAHELQLLAVTYVRMQQGYGQLRTWLPQRRRCETELFEALSERIVADGAFVAQLDASRSTDLLVAMTRIGLGSVPALHALLARVVLVDGGLRAARLSELQLANLIWALGKTATHQLARSPAPAPFHPAGADAPAERRGANWLWSELTDVASERLVDARASSVDGVRALWGISQAGRFFVAPLRTLVAAIVGRLEALGPPLLEEAAPSARAPAPDDARSAPRVPPHGKRQMSRRPFFPVPQLGPLGAARATPAVPVTAQRPHADVAIGSEPQSAAIGSEPQSAAIGSEPQSVAIGSEPQSVAAPGRAWLGWNLSTEAQLFLALASIELEAPAALPPIRARTWTALQRAHEASAARSGPLVSELQLEVCAMLRALGLKYRQEVPISIPLAAGALTYHVDMRLDGLPVLIEVHGASHLLFGQTLSYSSQKHRLLRMHGYKLVEVFAHTWNAHRGSHEQLAAHLADLLAQDAGLLVRHPVATARRPPSSVSAPAAEPPAA